MSAPEKEYIPSWLDDYPLTPLEFRLFCRISRRGECTQSPGKLAKEWGLSDRTIRDAQGLLLAAGLIGRRPNGPQRFILFTLGRQSWARPEDIATIRANVLNYRGKTETSVTTTEVDATEVNTTEDKEHNRGNNNLGDNNQGNSNHSTSVITTDIRESHEGNPMKEREREQAQGLPLTGLIHTEPNKAEQSDGRKKNGRKENKSGAPADDPALAAFRDRLKEHREATVGAPAGVQYFTQEAAGIRALWAKVSARQFTEADCIELFDVKLKQWRARQMTGHLPNWLYISQDIDPYVKNRSLMPSQAPRSGFVSQADINAPRPGRVVL